MGLKQLFLSIFKIIKKNIGNAIGKIIVKGFLWGIPIKEDWIENDLDLTFSTLSNDFTYYPCHKDKAKFAKVLNEPKRRTEKRGVVLSSSEDRIIKQVKFRAVPNNVQTYFILRCGYDNYKIDNLDEEVQEKILAERI